jgi:hypothetical protein
MLVLFSGCVTQQQVAQVKDLIESNKQPVEVKPVVGKPVEVNLEPVKQNDLDFVQVWKGNKAVKDWKVTTSLKVSVQPKLRFETTQEWKGQVLFANGKVLSGNIWIVVQMNGKWTATTCEWIRPGKVLNISRSMVFEEFRDKAELDHDNKVGDIVYFFLSGLIRTGARNVQERSEVVEVVL